MFVAATVDTWLRHYDHTRPRFEVDVDGRGRGRFRFAIVSNQRPYTYLGHRPLLLSPHAGLDVPLTLTVFRSIEVSLLLRSAASALRSGRMLARHPKLAERTDLRALTITGYGPFPWQVDGDYLGEVERLDISWQPDFLTIVMP